MDEKERKAFEGDAFAQCAMGDDYFFEAFDADIEYKDVLYKKALYWYHRAAQKGHAASQYNLAYQYEHGLGTDADMEQAVYWYRRAANQGYGTAENNLGHLYETGNGLPQDYGLALHWYGRAARHDDADGQCNTAIMYQFGYAGPRDYDKAAYWYAQAAKRAMPLPRTTWDTFTKRAAVSRRTGNWQPTGTMKPPWPETGRPRITWAYSTATVTASATTFARPSIGSPGRRLPGTRKA